jgi:hypothetical protein
MSEACSTNREEERVYVIGGKARAKEATRKPSRWWVDNIKMDLGEIGWEVLTGLVWFRIRTSGGLL